MKTIDLMTEANQQKVITLNRVAQASHIQILNKNNPLINEGLLKVVEPKNKAQAYFLNADQVIVQLSKAGTEFLFKALV